MTNLGERVGELVELEVDGVPTYVVDSGQTPVAALCFRVGMADERLSTRGWTHLVEHLVMHELRRPEVDANASVDLWSTQFQCTGEKADVQRWLRDLSGLLADLRDDALEHERKVLLAEAAQRSYSDVGWHLDLRYGVQGVGLANYEELGLRVLTAEALREHAGRHFTSGNAALALNFVPDDELALPLPAGDRVPIPRAEPLTLHLPGRQQGRPKAVTVSGLLTDSELSNIVAAVCADAVTERLRHQSGSSYGTQVAVERVDEDSLVMVLSADVTDEATRTAGQQVREVLERMARDGADPAAVERAVTRMRRTLDDEPTKVWQAFNTALARLRGRTEPVTVERVREVLDHLTPDQVTEEVRSLTRTAIYGAPEDGLSFGLPELMYPQGQETGARTPGLTRSDSTVFRPLKAEDPSRLAISAETVALLVDGRAQWFPVRDTVAVLTYPDGAVTALPRDGRAVHLEPGLWHHGARAAELLVETLRPHADVIPMDERDPAHVVRLTPAQRARKVLRLVIVTRLALPILAALVVLALVLQVWGLGLIVLCGWTYAAGKELMRERDRREELFR